MSITSYGLPNPVDNREMYEDPGMALYMSNKISAMENEYDEYSIPDVDNFIETIDRQLETEFGLEANKITEGFVKFFKFLKDNIMKFIGFVYDFAMKLFKSSMDINAYYKKAVQSLKMLENELKKKEDTDETKEDISVHNSLYRVRYAMYGIMAIFIFIRNSYDLEKLGDGEDLILIPYRFSFLLMAFPDLMQRIPEDEKSYDLVQMLDNFIASINESHSRYSDDMVRDNVEKNDTKEQIISLIGKYCTKLENINVSSDKLSLSELKTLNEEMLDNMEMMDFTEEGDQTFNFGKEFKRIDNMRKKSMKLFKEVKTPEDLAAKIDDENMIDNKQAFDKILKVMADSTKSVSEIKEMTNTTIKSFVGDINRYITEVKAYVKK